ncbi:MAG: hypothetical protein CMF59_17060 [Leptospiraceae bacterium]|nr:hypothetical protein [Leptospiraceae bacterium]
MADKVREIQDRLLKNIQDGDQLSAAIAYFPLIGWIYPLYFKKEDKLCQYHGKQGQQLNAVLIGLYLVLWFLENFWLTSWIFGTGSLLNPISSSVKIIALFGYLGLSLVAAYRAFMDEEWEIPFLQDIVDFFWDLFPQRKADRD